MEGMQVNVSPRNTRVCVLGLGYVGLPTAALLASMGYKVFGTDLNARIVEGVNAGRPRSVEPHLDELVSAGVRSGRLKAGTSPSEAEVYVICVPTPCMENHEPDLRCVFAATESICGLVKEGDLVVVESTVPPRTTEEVAELIASRTGLRAPAIRVAHAPERILPGHALQEAVENARIVGGVDEISTQHCAAFYRTFVTGELHLTDSRTAETVKLLENAYRDVNVAFANEVSLLADELSLNVWELIRLANQHPRVRILSPGAGVGGHCIAVDPWFLAARVPGVTKLIQTARGVNDHKAEWVAERVLRRAARIRNPRIACLGLAYKPDIDDLRESPAVKIVRTLIAAKVGEIRVVEPNISEHPEFQLASLAEALRDADIVVCLVGHRQFRNIPPLLLAERIVIDVCGVLQSQAPAADPVRPTSGRHVAPASIAAERLAQPMSVAQAVTGNGQGKTAAEIANRSVRNPVDGGTAGNGHGGNGNGNRSGNGHSPGNGRTGRSAAAAGARH